MALDYFTGFECGLGQNVDANSPDGYPSAGAGAFSTATKRSGTMSLSMPMSATQFIWDSGSISFIDVLGPKTIRFSYLQPGSFSPTTTGHVFFQWRSPSDIWATLRSNLSGDIEFRDNTGTTKATIPIASITADTWHEIEIRAISQSSATLWFNGTQIGGTLTMSSTGFSNVMSCNFSSTIPGNGGTYSYFIDDLVAESATNGNGPVAIGDRKVVVLRPISDWTNSGWNGGAGSGASLFDAVNNTPPIGTSTETNTTQIESADTSGTASYHATTQTYLAAGVGASDTINALMAVGCHGEDVSTGAKTGYIFLSDNPNVGIDGTFTYGPTGGGALGVYPSNWKWDQGSFQISPSVTKSNNGRIAIVKSDTGSRVASCCFLGILVLFTPAASGSIFTITPTGGVALSGTADYDRVNNAAVSGGVALSGTAGRQNNRGLSTSGGMVFSGTAARSNVRPLSVSGGATFSGIAARVNINSFTVSGGAVFSGAAGRQNNRRLTVLGGAVFSGTAPLSTPVKVLSSGGTVAFAGIANYLRVNLIPVSGGVTLSGSAGRQNVNVLTVSGGVSYGGSAGYLRTNAILPSGGASFSGTSPITTGGFTLTAGGTVSFAGSALRANINSLSVSGVVAFSGSATRQNVNVILPAGGAVFGGTSRLNRLRSYIGSGGVTLSGTAVRSKTNVIPASGGILLSGTAPISNSEAHTLPSSGTVNFSGTATRSKTKVIPPTGQVTFSGFGNASFTPVGGPTVVYRVDKVTVGVNRPIRLS